MDAPGAEAARLDGLAQLPAETAADPREQCVFTRIWLATLESGRCSGTLAAAVFHAAVAGAAQRIKGKGNAFQRLDDTAELFADAGYADLPTVLGSPTWQRPRDVAARHLLTHNDGVVDDRYLAKVPTSPARRGERLTITKQLTRQAIADTQALCVAIAVLTAP